MNWALRAGTLAPVRCIKKFSPTSRDIEIAWQYCSRWSGDQTGAFGKRGTPTTAQKILSARIEFFNNPKQDFYFFSISKCVGGQEISLCLGFHLTGQVWAVFN